MTLSGSVARKRSPRPALVGHDRRHAADLLEVVDRRVEAGEQLVGQRAGLEATAERAGRRRARLVRSPGLQQRSATVGDPEVGAAELVGRAEQHVGADRADVDRLVRRVVDRVHPGQRPDAVGQLADARRVDDRADGVGGPDERDHRACARSAWRRGRRSRASCRRAVRCAGRASPCRARARATERRRRRGRARTRGSRRRPRTRDPPCARA